MKIVSVFLPIFIGFFLFFESVPVYVNTQCNLIPPPPQKKLGLPWKEPPCNYKGIMWGKSILEILLEQSSSQYNSQKIQEMINLGCVLYFDGCNKCQVEKGKKPDCGINTCETYQEPKCLQYQKF